MTFKEKEQRLAERKDDIPRRKKRFFVRRDLRFVGAGMVTGALWIVAIGAAQPLSALISLSLGALFIFIGGAGDA